jgi:hypothetical protein
MSSTEEIAESLKSIKSAITNPKARKNLETFVLLRDGEQYLAYSDGSLFGSATKGMVLTNQRLLVFNKKRMRWSIDLDRIDGIEFEKALNIYLFHVFAKGKKHEDSLLDEATCQSFKLMIAELTGNRIKAFDRVNYKINPSAARKSELLVNTATFGLLLFLAGLLWSLGFLLINLFSADKTIWMSASTSAVIVDVGFSPYKLTRGGVDMGTYCGPYIVYEFEVDGKIYEGRKTIAETCDNLGEYMGDHVKVYYVPNSPDDSTAQISDSAFPKLSLVLIVVGILLMLPGFLQVDQ